MIFYNKQLASHHNYDPAACWFVDHAGVYENYFDDLAFLRDRTGIEALIAAGGNNNAVAPDGSTVLERHCAIIESTGDSVDLLLDLGADASANGGRWSEIFEQSHGEPPG